MKTKPLLSALPALSLALCLAPAAGADAPTGHRAAGSERFPISVEAIEAKRADVFAAADGNGDGLVNLSEFMAFEPERGQHHFPRGFHGLPPGAARGERGDQAWSDEKVAAMDDALFQALDSNGDGMLARSEFSHEALMAARRNEMKEGMFERLDADGDGYLSPGEFPPAHLTAMDANGDGEITRDEMHRPERPGPG